jgi:hypothetical protein
VSSIRDVYIFVLIYVVSLALQSSVSLNIHNQYQNINLTSPVYFIHGGKWNVVPDQKVDVNAVMRNYIEFDSGQDILEGALVYRIQRKHAKYDEFVQDGSKNIQLLVGWYVEHTKELDVRAVLVEHEKELNEDKVMRLHQKYWHSLKMRTLFIRSSWLLDDTTALKTTIKVMNGGCKWDIFITEEIKNNVEKSLRINAER